ncbi:LysR substrate-binding domain-containing protein [Hydrogenophaga sp. 5NK40-0174]|uniref:LysR substrate-binding domain-containing protein n=1 Tax=Hydrogenophaga sp. 5NK40-0174 TaxID=3127649 RepID=UPI00310AC4E1
METKWLEDFVSLAETRSFSRSAQLRHVTQPAFSRRIQSLEAWAGTDLVDRTSYPTRLTAAGQVLYEQSLELLRSLQTTRSMVRAYRTTGQDTIEFAVPHTLAFTFFPGWLSGLRGHITPIKSKLMASNVHDAVLRMVESSCDVLISYHLANQPIPLDTTHYEMLQLGNEVLSPYVRPNAQGAPKHALPGTAASPLPYLAYSDVAYMGRAVEQMLKQGREPVFLNRIYETDMAESLKAMALEGHGVAFLPESAVRNEVRTGRLVRAGEGYEIVLDIRIYRERKSPRKPKPALEVFWNELRAHQEALNEQPPA